MRAAQFQGNPIREEHYSVDVILQFGRTCLRELALGLTLCGAAACSKSEPEPKAESPRPSEPHVAVTPPEQALRVGDPSLPPRRAIAGIAGFQSSSRIVFDREPGKVHTLAATFLFPERTRLCLSLEQDKRLERVILYRAGTRSFSIDQDVSSSKELAGEERAGFFLQTELRRALFLWPDGFAWSGEGRARAAELGSAGRLEAQVGLDGRPLSMGSFDAAGNRAELLEAIAWKQKGARYFPSHFTLKAGAELIWSEDVLEFETALDYVDDFFLPPDRRAPDVLAGKAPADPVIEAIDLPAVWELRVALKGDATANLTEARKAAEALSTTWRDRGVAVQAGTILELDRRGALTAFVLNVPDAGTPPAEGWKLRPERPAWSMALVSVGALNRAAIESMAVRLPPEGVADFELHIAENGSGAEAARLVAARSLR